MKTKKRLLMFCGLVCALVLSLSLSIGVMFAGTDPVLSTATPVASSYELGTELEIPQGTITVGESTVAAETVLVFPDGSAYSTTLSVLTQEGAYTLQYRAMIAGKLYVKEVPFVVQSKLYGCSSGTTYSYGTYVAEEHNPKNFQPTGGEVTGLKVALSGGDTFRYNKVIDLNTLTEKDQIIKFAITPVEIGTADTMEMYMYLTDAYDPDNQIKIKVRQPEPIGGYSNIYMSAAAGPNQALTGKEWNSGRVHVGGAYGAPFRANFAGFFKDGNGTVNSSYLSTIPENTVQFSMNYAERELHNTIRPASVSSTVVADFDNSEFFAEAWEGFTTGEVFVSIMSPNSTNFVITEIAGRDVSDMTFGERTKPMITVNYGEYTEDTIPNAVVGQPYALYEATARSPYVGQLAVESHVYGNYYASNRYELLVENGVFKPTVPGTYFIAYEARDNFGQVGSKIIPINAVANPEEMVITRNDSVSTGVAGYPIEISVPTVDKKIGNAKIVATYTVDGSDPVVINNNSFVPTKAGTYAITLTATDYVQRVKALTYNVVVDAGTKPVLEKEPTLPMAFVAGCEYELPQISAYNFTDGTGAKVAVTISATSSSGEKIVRGGKYTPAATINGEKVTIKYSATIASGTIEWTKEVPVVIPKDENGDLHLERFLVVNGDAVTSVVANDNDTSIGFAPGDGSVSWANPLIANGLSVVFASGDTGENYSGVSMMLMDSLNPEQSFVVTYERTATSTLVYLNYDKSTTRVSAQSFGNPEDQFTLGYNSDSKAVKYDTYDSDLFAVTKTIYGEEFTGFDSGKVYVAFRMEGVTRATQVKLISVAAQIINNAYGEYIGPRITMTGTYGGTIQYGTNVTLHPAIAADVVDPSAKCFLTVKAPDGSVALAKDGTPLNKVPGEVAYELPIVQYGSYRVSYESKDMNGNDALKFTYVINVPDNEKPVIKVNKKVATTGKVGTAIEIPSFTVEDNISEGDEIVSGVLFITSQGNTVVVDLAVNKGFIPDRAGKYFIRYYAYDKDGNFTVVTYEITVTDK